MGREALLSAFRWSLATPKLFGDALKLAYSATSCSLFRNPIMAVFFLFFVFSFSVAGTPPRFCRKHHTSLGISALVSAARHYILLKLYLLNPLNQSSKHPLKTFLFCWIGMASTPREPRRSTIFFFFLLGKCGCGEPVLIFLICNLTSHFSQQIYVERRFLRLQLTIWTLRSGLNVSA